MSVVTWHSHHTKLTACRVERCDYPGLGNLVAVGSYQLIQATGTREGQVELGVVVSRDIGDNVSYESHHILDTPSLSCDSHQDRSSASPGLEDEWVLVMSNT